jgi:hypothetical protein
MLARMVLGSICVVACFGCGVERDTPEIAPMSSAVEYEPFAGELPDMMSDALDTLVAGELLEPDVLHQLFDYAHANPNDARPWLLLARDSMLREWGGVAERQYASAIEADPRVLETSFVLRDLLIVASEYIGIEQGEAVALIVDNWGSEALPAIDAARASAEQAGDENAAAKLASLRDEIEAAR